MKMHARTVLIGTLTFCGAAASAQAFVTRVRWVERIGDTDVVLGENGSTVGLSSGTPHRIRLQFGVFGDDEGSAPAGGFLGWGTGVLELESATTIPTATRTPGRLSPYTAAPHPNANGSPPLPGGDPFTRLTLIDADVGLQTFAWLCGPDGNPLPMPVPVVRGFEEFVSVFEFTVLIPMETSRFQVSASGYQFVATGWRPFGTPVPPDCEAGEPGSVVYAPMAIIPAEFFESTLNVVVPAPMGVIVLAAALPALMRRRR